MADWRTIVQSNNSGTRQQKVHAHAAHGRQRRAQTSQKRVRHAHNNTPRMRRQAAKPPGNTRSTPRAPTMRNKHAESDTRHHTRPKSASKRRANKMTHREVTPRLSCYARPKNPSRATAHNTSGSHRAHARLTSTGILSCDNGTITSFALKRGALFEPSPCASTALPQFLPQNLSQQVTGSVLTTCDNRQIPALVERPHAIRRRARITRSHHGHAIFDRELTRRILAHPVRA